MGTLARRPARSHSIGALNPFRHGGVLRGPATLSDVTDHKRRQAVNLAAHGLTDADRWSAKVTRGGHG